MKIYLSVILFCVSFSLCSQNLVPNPSFEDTIGCPNTFSQINLAPPWFNPALHPDVTPKPTPDYFNQCDTSNKFGIPDNIFGYQYAKEGIAYAGIYVLNLGFSNVREYIEVKLIDTLINSKKYYVSFYVNLAESSKYAMKNMGAYLSKEIVIDSTALYLPYIPQITNSLNNPPISKTKWTLISGTFIASGGEKYITIGNFKDDTDTILVENNASVHSYYYIDDVSVVLYEDTAETETNSEIFIPTAFTPNNDGQNDILYVRGGLKNMEIKIFNRWGLKVFETNEQSRGWNGVYKGEKQPTANYVYMFKGTTTQGKEITKNGVVSLIR